MGQASRRKLRIIDADPSEPFDVELSPESRQRLNELYSASVGAKMAAQAAMGSAQALAQRYDDALASLYAAEGINPGWKIEVRLDLGCLRVTKKPKDDDG